MKEVEPSMERVAVIPWLDKEHCYIVVSGKHCPKKQFGEKWYTCQHKEHVTTYTDIPARSDPAISFTFVKDGIAAEWDGACGPIQLWFKAENPEGDDKSEATPHWLWPFATGRGMWSQMAMDYAGLSKCFINGDYDSIFTTLRSFVLSRLQERNENGN